MVSFEAQVEGLMTLPEREELEVRAMGQERDREALYRVMGARRHWEKVLHRVSACHDSVEIITEVELEVGPNLWRETVEEIDYKEEEEEGE